MNDYNSDDIMHSAVVAELTHRARCRGQAFDILMKGIEEAVSDLQNLGTPTAVNDAITHLNQARQRAKDVVDTMIKLSLQFRAKEKESLESRPPEEAAT